MYGGIPSPIAGSVWGCPLSHCRECMGVSPLLLWGVYWGVPSPIVGSVWGYPLSYCGCVLGYPISHCRECMGYPLSHCRECMGVWFKLFRNMLLICTCGTIFSCEFVFSTMFELRLLHYYVMKCDLISNGVTENVTIYIL